MKRPPVGVHAALAACLALGAAAPLATAHAQQAGVIQEQAMTAAFKSGDVDNDGSIDIDEYVAYSIGLFSAADKNRDRFLTPEEAGTSAAQFRAADRNNDGKLSLGEVVASKVVDFFEIDVDRDGVITMREITVYERGPAAAAK